MASSSDAEHEAQVRMSSRRPLPRSRTSLGPLSDSGQGGGFETEGETPGLLPLLCIEELKYLKKA